MGYIGYVGVMGLGFRVSKLQTQYGTASEGFSSVQRLGAQSFSCSVHMKQDGALSRNACALLGRTKPLSHAEGPDAQMSGF